jgi:hypothetical protein
MSQFDMITSQKGTQVPGKREWQQEKDGDTDRSFKKFKISKRLTNIAWIEFPLGVAAFWLASQFDEDEPQIYGSIIGILLLE